jgi:catalase-peroxidase
LIDKAQLLNLTAPELTVLIGGMRALNANLTVLLMVYLPPNPGVLPMISLLILLDMRTQWKSASDDNELYEGTDRKTGEPKWTATRADLVFGSNSELRAIAEVYASSDAKKNL